MTIKQHEHIKEIIEKLQGYKENSAPVLSVYLRNDNGAVGYKLSEDFQRFVRKSITVDQAEKLKIAIDTIDAYLCRDYDLKKHLSGIAFFAGQNVWEIVHHDFIIPDVISYSHRPYIAPILQEFAKTGRYLFVVADREKADVFTFYQGGLEEYKEIYDPSVPQKVKSNSQDFYARNNIILRHIQNHVHRHLKKISKKVDTLIKGKSIEGVFIGGHKPLFHDIVYHLNHNLQQKLDGEFITELNIPQPVIIDHAAKVLQQYLQRRGVENYGRQTL